MIACCGKQRVAEFTPKCGRIVKKISSVCCNIICVKPEKAGGHIFYAVFVGFQNLASEDAFYKGMKGFYVEKIGKQLLCNTSILIFGQHAANSHNGH